MLGGLFKSLFPARDDAEQLVRARLDAWDAWLRLGLAKLCRADPQARPAARTSPPWGGLGVGLGCPCIAE